MFDANDLSVLDPKYFAVIFTDAFDVTIRSRNTGHYWFIHNPVVVKHFCNICG